jgi:hypothetical protein
LTIGADYPTPVYVNGYACNNCAQVAEAKKGVNPADPKAGPYGVDAQSNPQPVGQASASFGPAVVLGGQLAQSAPVSAAAAGAPATASPAVTSPLSTSGQINLLV